MSEGGKQSFAQFAADQNFPGVELDNTRRWNSGFKKVAVSPEHHRRRGTSTPPEVASERYLKAPRRGEIYEGRKATGRSDYAKARSESARNTPTVRPTGERPDLASPRSEGHSGKENADAEKPARKCIVCGKRHEPRCVIPPGWRREQKDKQKKAKEANRERAKAADKEKKSKA